jgi:hypothetical protein
MAFKYSDRVRNACAQAIETTIGTSPTLRIRSGAEPASTSAARTGTVLATIAMPSNWAELAATGQLVKSGVWEDNAADAAGNAGYFDITGTGSTVDIQGNVTATGGGGDMQLDNVNINAGQQVTVTNFSQQIGGA